MIRSNNSAPTHAELDDPETPACVAEAADLHYVTDDSPGISRRKAGKGFRYLYPDGRAVGEEETLLRIRSLAVPPAYRQVWICPDPVGHLQATGRDAKGRKQYRYHPRWAEVRDAAKYEKLASFARMLPSLRRRLAKHLNLPGLPRDKVLAACVRIIDMTYIRVGNDDYTRDNGSFGLTTLRDDHATFGRGGVVRFDFRGKHGIRRQLRLQDSQLARVVRACQELPGQELMQYLDADGTVCDVGSGDVNAYLAEHAAPGTTAKTFRTWHATVLAAKALRDVEPAEKKTPRNRQIVAAVDEVAVCMGNTRAVCRRCYIHPAVVMAFEEGTLDDLADSGTKVRGLSADESATLNVIVGGGGGGGGR